ncbi:MAG TPA: MMPL family transporter [Candidatus Saccharimonadales bacterium]|nr:MMPL family transporter [Candidatus Saccharimonadales bacterium]
MKTATTPPPDTPTKLGTFLRRSKWLVLLLWLVGMMVAVPLANRLNDVITTDQSTFLPAKAQSTKVANLTAATHNKTLLAEAVVVFTDNAGLNPQDVHSIQAARAKVDGLHLSGQQDVTPIIYSKDRQAAFFTVEFNRPRHNQTYSTQVIPPLRQALTSVPSRLDVKVTGDLAIDADSGGANADTKLIITSGIIVTILLLIIYRSPILWLVPLVAAGFATEAARAAVYGLGKAGLTVDSLSTSILIVLVFGAATDYALLILSRYREELHLHPDRHEAMARALRRTFEAVTASAGTVIVGLLAMLAASLGSSRGLGPIGATGIVFAWLVQMTFFPAILLVGGKWLLWPRAPKADGEPFAGARLWRHAGTRIAKRPLPIATITVMMLLVMGLGLAQLNLNANPLDSLRGNPPSVQGQNNLAAHFPAGETAPLTIVVPNGTQAESALKTVAHTEGVATVLPHSKVGNDTAFSAILSPDPYSDKAFQIIRTVRDRLSASAPSALVGGPQALYMDISDAALRDNKVVMPLILLVVGIVLGILLRALTAPLLLLGTVVLSFAASFGFSAFMFKHAFGFSGVDPALPLYIFLFLVALGVDYNIFLMDRARQEAALQGTRPGMLRALAVTGGVITAAGCVLAGTFASLAQLPIVTLTEVGFAVAFGILLDTLIVRSILVPALVVALGRRTWWPSKLNKNS